MSYFIAVSFGILFGMMAGYCLGRSVMVHEIHHDLELSNEYELAARRIAGVYSLKK